MKEIKELLAEHNFFASMTGADIELLAGCGHNEHFADGALIAREGNDADWFYLLRAGKVAIETPVPSGPPLRLKTLSQGEILGYSWLFAPYKWDFDIRAVGKVRAVALDGKCLRGKCDADPRLGYNLVLRFADIMTERLHQTRLQLLDVYGASNAATAG